VKQLLLFSLCFGILLRVAAQEEQIFNHYLMNPAMINPAASAFDDNFRLQFNGRVAWSGFEDAPQTLGVRAAAPIGQTFGIGAAVFSESAAQLQRFKGQLDFSFRFQFGREYLNRPTWNLAFGFYTQVQRMSLDNGITTNVHYEAGDEVIMGMIQGENEFDAAFGVYGSYLDNTYGGITINNLVANRLENIAGASTSNQLYYTLLLGHRFELTDLKVNLEPSVLIRQLRDAPTQVDINLKAGFLQDQLITGFSYRSLGIVGLLLGTQLSGLDLYYSYDLSFQQFQSYNTGTHEVTVALRIDRKKLEQRRRRNREKR
jgi:type IX secretion system PorP/SprF family membrane protein